MNGWLEAFTFWVADFYMLSTLLLVAAQLAISTLKQPVLRLVVARSAVVALVMLAALCATPGWSVVHLMSRRAETPPSEALAMPDVSRSALQAPVQQAAPPTVLTQQLAHSATINTPPRDALHVWTVALSMPLGAVQLAGGAVVAAWLAWGALAARRLLGESRAAPVELRRLLDGLVAPSQRDVALRVSERLDVAVALGVLRPTVLLPSTWLESRSSDELRTVLAHEAAHIEGSDLRWLAMCRGMLVLLWLQPLYWLLLRRMGLDQESLADAAAAEIGGRERYAEQLTRWARAIPARRRMPLAAAVGLWEGPSQLRRRMSLLLDDRIEIWRACSRRWRAVAGLTLVAVAFGLSEITLQPVSLAADDGRASKASAGAEPASETPVAASKSQWAGPGPQNSITGACVNGDSTPLADVEVKLYRIERDRSQRRLLAATSTDESGHFEFRDVVDLAKEYPEGLPTAQALGFVEFPLFQVVARKAGRATASQMDMAPQVADRGVAFHLEMPAATTLSGRVTSAGNRPVAGAEVVVGNSLQDFENLYTSRTDANGRYEITDLAPYDLTTERKRQEESMRPPRQREDGVTEAFVTIIADRNVRVTHPDFATREVRCDQIPGTTDVRLDAPATIMGVVLDGETGRGMANVPIAAASSRPKSESAWQRLNRKYDKAGNALYYNYSWQTTTDADGRYRFENLPAMAYDIWIASDESKHRGLDRVQAVAGETTEAPEMRLMPGGTIRVRLVDSTTNEPLARSELQRTGFALVPKDGVSARPSIGFSSVEPVDGAFDLQTYAGEFQAFCAGIVRDGKLVWVPDIQRLTDVPTMTVVAGEVTSIDLRMTKPKSVAAVDAAILRP